MEKNIPPLSSNLTEVRGSMYLEGFKIYQNNELFHSSEVVRGNIYRCEDHYYFKPDPNGNCVFDLSDNLEGGNG